MTTEQEILTALADIQARLARIEAKFSGSPAPQASAAVPEVASDADLDDPKYGNFAVRRDPNRWAGESMVGRTLSECPADYLDQLAEFFVWKGNQFTKEGDEKKANYQFRDAARCRGWAARNRIKVPAAYQAPKPAARPAPAPKPAAKPPANADAEDYIEDPDGLPF